METEDNIADNLGIKIAGLDIAALYMSHEPKFGHEIKNFIAPEINSGALTEK